MHSRQSTDTPILGMNGIAKSCSISHILNGGCDEQKRTEPSISNDSAWVKSCVAVGIKQIEMEQTSNESLDSLKQIYKSLFQLLEQHLMEKLDQFNKRLEDFQREQLATKCQMIRIESLLQWCMDYMKWNQRTTPNGIIDGMSGHLDHGGNREFQNDCCIRMDKKTSGMKDLPDKDNMHFTSEHGAIKPHISQQQSFWSAWMTHLIGRWQVQSNSTDAMMAGINNHFNAISPSISRANSGPASRGVTEETSLRYAEKEQHDMLMTAQAHRVNRVQRMRGRRLRGTNRATAWSNFTDGLRQFKRCHPYSRPFNATTRNNNFSNFIPHGFETSTANSIQEIASYNMKNDEQQNELRGMAKSLVASSRNSTHLAPTKSNNLVGNPIVILNPNEPREIFIGGIHTVPLPLWAYKKCLTMVRGEPHELGPRLCLRLLQSLFSLNYLVTHNYNGSGGKAPIDPTVMGAVLRQAQIQFGSGYFFTEPMALGKLRDYLNNAFRVMAFRQRKGERVRSPFWNEKGEPVHGLDAPAEFAENSDVIVLTRVGEMRQDPQATSISCKQNENKNDEYQRTGGT